MQSAFLKHAEIAESYCRLMLMEFVCSLCPIKCCVYYFANGFFVYGTTTIWQGLTGVSTVNHVQSYVIVIMTLLSQPSLEAHKMFLFFVTSGSHFNVSSWLGKIMRLSSYVLIVYELR